MSHVIVDPEDQISVLSVQSLDPSPDTITSLVRRVKTLTLKLLPLEVPPDTISDPTGRIITPAVINAYIDAAGDFVEALPYCLLRARKEFLFEANHNPADYGENDCRATACEVLARRIVHQAPPEKIYTVMFTRYRYRELDGDVSGRSSALETAIDSHCTIFLSSSEAQDVVQDLWCGRTIQLYDADGDTKFVPRSELEYDSFWSRIDPQRIGVPRYQNIFGITVWFLFLFTYSQAVREPLDKLDPNHRDLDLWEVVMYVLALAFSFEDLHKIFKLITLVTWRALGFWNIVSFISDSLLTAAFVLRVAGIVAANHGGQSDSLRYHSFQCLSFAAPLLWMKLIPIFDGYKFVGTMQICVARMLKESGFFFCLLALLGIGFLQGLYALDAADGNSDHPIEILNGLIQALLQAPNYDMFSGSPAGLGLYYMWNVATAIILLNVLISLFSSAYNDVIEDAAAEYLTYFAGKVVGMIRAPDEFVYPPPFNLVETFLVAPFEFYVSQKTYAKINRHVMQVVFFIPLCVIALFEAHLDPAKNRWVKDWFTSPDEGGEDAPHFQDPEVNGDDGARGLKISKVPFSELIKAFPDTTHSSETVILKEFKALRKEITELKELVKGLAAEKQKTE
ncbi:calcium activated cation channel [Dichomitus squalens]|uniref:Calcium activated cation channel n=2 Tax=Dichomitus squalens TaxID=114155 RepID=A0A4Q9Q6Q8_9APHY|nr:calcium activated cation channel [Dichomitus squalens LYAD-421 SS1]EJF62394.1 calcium activated cation channel [Dichomitus squalens LYAD-421 SS1]TBU39699.1 calcium activated cation channel [Dichomitus squalens]TBU63132.1 calcium activated cation channel [Dichomitus squalens]